jgi:hypothetical protein
MIEFSINGQDYKVTNVTISQFYKIQHLLIVEGADAKLQIVSYLSDCPVKELKTLEQFQFMQLFNSIAEGPLNTEADKKLYKHIGLNGKAYGLLDFSKITIGEFADMDVLKADPMKEQKLHTMMAILYRPAIVISESADWIAIEPYDSDTIETRATEFLDLPMKYVYSALSFFLLMPKYLLNDIVDSQMQEMTNQILKEKDPKMKLALQTASQLIFELQEDGTTPSILSLETIYSKLTKLQELTQRSSSTSSHIEKTNNEKKKIYNDK